jgi:hypothetical protein
LPARCWLSPPVVEEGPAEKAGKDLDKAMEHTGDTMKKAGESVGDKIDEAGKKLKDAAGR